MGLQQVKGLKQKEGPDDPCQTPLGACGPAGDCDKRCKASHVEGEGSCNLGLCTCTHWCKSTP
ncbi:hypothetical protein TSUD_213890 [Trifolium subterraneum]|uniref:Knottin scorpion toxin-like domain-containing protein n=1 Tax=Trifolium subterraneum TaxID=3900 RepID=A0A2Z6NLX9_TRISU|nr:hypothetical protein TSUD_213890 [Trifolium subterraneum]